MNWLQLCALGTTSLTVWNIERSDSLHILQPSKIELPAAGGLFAESLAPSSQTVSSKLQAQSIMVKPSTRGRLTPSASCWTATSELYVGCAEGFLLLADPESRSVSVLFNPTTADAIPELRRNSFQGLALDKNGLIAVGKENVAHCLQIKGTQINITQTWQLERPVTTVTHSPDYKTLLLSSNTGQIYVLNPPQSDKIVKVLDVLSGNFVTAALLHDDKNICVSLRESGELQLWSSGGICLSSLSLKTEVTCLACCPIAHYAAVGTATGKVLFIDLNQEHRPRLVHQVYLYHSAVDHLVFDHDGHYLFTSGSDSHVYILDAKPSRMFSVIGCTVFPGRILSLSTQCIRDRNEVKVLALCSGEEDGKQDGSLLTVLSLPAQNLEGPGSVDRPGCLSSHVLRVFRFRVPRPLKSCALGVGEVFAYCHRNKTLQRFVLPEDTGNFSNQQAVELKPEQEVRGHPLGPASLVLSPHRLWLASVGRDGLLRIRETASMERYIELQCHSCDLDGVRSVSFSTDSCTLLTVGLKDGSLVCTNIRVKGGDVSKMNEATQYSKSVAHFLKNIFDTENPVLINFPVRGRLSPAGTEYPGESKVSGGPSVDVAGQNESDSSLLCAPPSQTTWLESRREALMKEENEQFSEIKKNLRETIKELRDSILEMMGDSENQPEQHFNLDVEEQRRLEAMVEQEVTRVRTEIEWDIVEKCYLRDIIKRERWDTMKVIGRTVKAFHSDLEVLNYPLRERTEAELENLCRVQNMRKLEKAACSLSSLKKGPNAQEEELEGKAQEAESATLTGSISTQLGYSNPYVYDQLSLQTVEQRINQIILLQDVIYRIKTAFNADFEALHRQKVQELKHVRDRNKHIREIVLQLELHEEMWEPSLTVSEWPERLLAVEDSEIKAERYLTAEQREEEERRKLEEERRLAAQADDSRERALGDMMDGVLEVKKEDILKMEIPPPEFVLTKPDIQWSEEEKKVFREYEKKAKELSEEKEKHKKLLETEIKKLHRSNKEATERFDENLAKLLEKKMNCTVAIYQEELKITCLVDSVLREEEIRSQEQELKLKLEIMLASKNKTGEKLKNHEEEVEMFQEAYDRIVLEDKLLDKEFRKEFVDVPGHLVDQLYKLFKRRPRAQKMRTQTDNNSNTLKEHGLCGSLGPDVLSTLLRAMEALDAPENMPEGLNPAAWDRLCLVRRTKVESEQKVKAKALTLAEMRAFLQNRRDEDKAAQEEIENLREALERLHRERNHLLVDTTVQVILKQGQVVSTTDPAANNADTVLILYHRSVVDNLRSSIRTLAEQKIASMEACKEVRKGIIQQEWELKVMRKEIEDLNDKARSIKMSRLSEEQQQMTYRSKSDQASHTAKQISSLEKSIALMQTTHEKNVQQRLKKIERINKRAAAKAEKSAILEQEIPGTHVTVSELRHIFEATTSEENEAARREERYREIVQRSRLEELARAQAEELAFLTAEVERLTMKNFPSLDMLKHY
ncbi:cilia- and flagella-associated protein 43 isoform X2 [Archocentrus centrarchus]|nr:cilia- and flagella-associated protein 43 isoform X2 [Archocentrus centrarchus]XP_030603267.1 cilia- and flagella-associated protein 43 isoform X2 [Archocentrus centrarchus]